MNRRFCCAKRKNDLAEKEMPYFTKVFGFKAF